MSGAMYQLSYMPSCISTNVLLPSTCSGYTAKVGEIRVLYGILVAEYFLNCFKSDNWSEKLTLGWLQRDAL